MWRTLTAFVMTDGMAGRQRCPKCEWIAARLEAHVPNCTMFAAQRAACLLGNPCAMELWYILHVSVVATTAAGCGVAVVRLYMFKGSGRQEQA